MSIPRFRAGFRNISRNQVVACTRNFLPGARPWFITGEEDPNESESELLKAVPIPSKLVIPTPPSSGSSLGHVLPPNVPAHVQVLHGMIKNLPFFDPNCVRVISSGTEETAPVPAPPLPSLRQRGRRRVRGGTDFGTGVDIFPNANEGIWPWLIFAQIKEGVNRKATVNELFCLCKNLLPGHSFHLSRDSRGSTEPTDGWTLVDAGDFAIHILNFQAKQKWFPILKL